MPMRITGAMGFLSRKTKEEDRPPEAERATDDVAPEAWPPEPESEEIKVSENGQNNGNSAEGKHGGASVAEQGTETPTTRNGGATRTEQETGNPAAPGREAEEAAGGNSDGRAAEEPAGSDSGEADSPQRFTPAELMAPDRRQMMAAKEREADEEPTTRAEVIAFANQKGGVAKTTTTLNLAVAFKESGHRVLCVDLDPQGNLTMSQGIDPDKVEKSLFDVLVYDMPIREIIVEREIDIAVASIDLAGAEIAMSTKIGRERSLERALKEVSGEYDFICIDTPPSLGLLTINALTAATKVIVPVQCEYLSMRGLVQLQNTLKMIQENLNPDVVIEGILPTMLDSRTVHAKEAVEILEENFGDLVFKSRIRKAIKFAEAPVRGASVLKYDPDGNAANYYRELAKEVLTNGSSS
jgi:chromosome partitioning protein